MYKRIKAVLSEDAVFHALLLLIVGITSFGLGKRSEVAPAASDQSASIVLIESGISEPGKSTESIAVSVDATAGKYVVSKNGSKYHLPWCPGVKQMKEENKVWFTKVEDAKAAGYTPAANCPGLN